MNYYTTCCITGYSLLGEKPPMLEPNSAYTIVSESKYFTNCVIIKRKDEKEYHGNTLWIVPTKSLTLV